MLDSNRSSDSPTLHSEGSSEGSSGLDSEPGKAAMGGKVEPRNVGLFIAFRVLFNARWYYPVLAILFLDYGLSLEQYALLNVAWAVSIVCLEVPSGALADQIGRRRMVVLAAVLMVIEQAIFAFAPAGASWLFWAFLVNRILSGAAEASASGADEALAYDSLVEVGQERQWPAVLGRVMKWQSVGFFIAMMLGAAVYDAHLLQAVADRLGLGWHFDQATTLRFPLYLTLGNALGALWVTTQMKEPSQTKVRERVTFASTYRTTLEAGRWLWRSPAALGILLAGLCFDSIIRLFLTIGSNYYRLIGLPEAAFGLIGSGFALLGYFSPRLAQGMVQRFPIEKNFAWVAGAVMSGLIGVSLVWPFWGVLLVIPLGLAMSLLGFFVSHYLNQLVTDSAQRATVLSFKGLLFNLAYGGAGLMFAGLSRALAGAGNPDAVFARALVCLPWYFAGTVVVLVLVLLRWRTAGGRPSRQEGQSIR